MVWTKELYCEVVRRFKEGYSYRKIEALLKERFGVSYRDIGYLITSFKVAREVEGDFYEAERKARKIIEEAEREAAEIRESVEEQRNEWKTWDEMARGAMDVVNCKRQEYRELTSSIDSLKGREKLLLQAGDQKQRAIEELEKRVHSLEDTCNALEKRGMELVNNPEKRQPFFASLSAKDIATLRDFFQKKI